MTHFKKPQYIVTDIEGTTTSIDFVHNELFPYSRDRMESFLTENWNSPKLVKCIELIESHPDAHEDHLQSPVALSHLLKKGYVKKKVSIRDARQKIYEISKIE